jgi:hypothetical protein
MVALEARCRATGKDHLCGLAELQPWSLWRGNSLECCAHAHGLDGGESEWKGGQALPEGLDWDAGSCQELVVLSPGAYPADFGRLKTLEEFRQAMAREFPICGSLLNGSDPCQVVAGRTRTGFVLAGGAVSGVLSTGRLFPGNDLDLFLVTAPPDRPGAAAGDTGHLAPAAARAKEGKGDGADAPDGGDVGWDATALALVAGLLVRVRAWWRSTRTGGSSRLLVFRNRRCVTITSEGGGGGGAVSESAGLETRPGGALRIQIILQAYRSVGRVLHHFDLGSCAVAFDGRELFFSPRGKFAFETGLNVVDLSVHRATFEQRVAKYEGRGFGIALPGLDPRKLPMPAAQRWWAGYCKIFLPRLRIDVRYTRECIAVRAIHCLQGRGTLRGVATPPALAPTDAGSSSRAGPAPSTGNDTTWSAVGDVAAIPDARMKGPNMVAPPDQWNVGPVEAQGDGPDRRHEYSESYSFECEFARYYERPLRMCLFNLAALRKGGTADGSLPDVCVADVFATAFSCPPLDAESWFPRPRGSLPPSPRGSLPPSPPAGRQVSRSGARGPAPSRVSAFILEGERLRRRDVVPPSPPATVGRRAGGRQRLPPPPRGSPLTAATSTLCSAHAAHLLRPDGESGCWQSRRAALDSPKAAAGGREGEEVETAAAFLRELAVDWSALPDALASLFAPRVEYDLVRLMLGPELAAEVLARLGLDALLPALASARDAPPARCQSCQRRALGPHPPHSGDMTCRALHRLLAPPAAPSPTDDRAAAGLGAAVGSKRKHSLDAPDSPDSPRRPAQSEKTAEPEDKAEPLPDPDGPGSEGESKPWDLPGGAGRPCTPGSTARVTRLEARLASSLRNEPPLRSTRAVGTPANPLVVGGSECRDAAVDYGELERSILWQAGLGTAHDIARLRIESLDFAALARRVLASLALPWPARGTLPFHCRTPAPEASDSGSALFPLGIVTEQEWYGPLLRPD